MGTETMGRVTVTAKIENLRTILYMAEKGLLPADQVRSIEVNDALVDTGATILSMPKSMIEYLGFEPGSEPNGFDQRGHSDRAALRYSPPDNPGRECPTDVSELPDECPGVDRPDTSGVARFCRRHARAAA